MEKVGYQPHPLRQPNAPEIQLWRATHVGLMRC